VVTPSPVSEPGRGSPGVFADASYWVALVNDDDRWHSRAVELSSKVPLGVGVLDLAASDALTIVGARLGGKAAQTLYQFFLDSCRLVFSDADSLAAAMRRHLTHDGRLSVADCAIVEAMVAEQDQSLLSFDSDFDSIKGLERLC
jgi:predicted nucleic acid-binding protein